MILLQQPSNEGYAKVPMVGEGPGVRVGGAWGVSC